MKEFALMMIGAALFGSRQQWGRIAAETALDLSPGERASLWGRDARCGVDAAAMANGTATHGFELDDLHLRSSMHPGAVTIPAAFALAASYERLISADVGSSSRVFA